VADNELLDRHFDLFKHLTTLDSGAVLATLVIYREVGMEKADLIPPLLSFGFSLVIALIGSYGIAQGAYVSYNDQRPPRWMLGLSVGMFASGVGVVALSALWPPVSALWSVLFA
jgi:hypothetical protein